MPKPFWWPSAQAIISLSIIGVFGVAYFIRKDPDMDGALIAAFAGSWGYWLGSSSGASKANDRLANATGSDTPK